MYLPSDFAYDYVRGHWHLSFLEDGKRIIIQGYKSAKECQEAIRKLSNPEKIKRPIYSWKCTCITSQWRYYEEEKEGIVFKVCTVCNKPLDMDIVNHFAKDFDLDKFIAGEQ